FGNMAGNVLKNVSNIIIARGYGAELFGLYSASFSLIMLVASIFQLGLNNAMVRYVAVYRSKQETNSLRGLMIFCTIIAGVGGLVGACLFLSISHYLAITVYGKKQLLM